MSAAQRSPDAEAIREDELQYRNGTVSNEQLDAMYPDRPHNHSKTFPFHDLFLHLFDPLDNARRKPTGPTTARTKQGPHGPHKLSSSELKDSIIRKFIARWRTDVGDDFYPALRLICPDQDRDRPMYGLKEKAIAKLLVKLLKLSPRSEDADALLNWKLPGKLVNRKAGDFAGICFDILSKRAMRSKVGNMSIAEVNELLDKLAAAQKEESQLPIFQQFYGAMNASELMWLIRIILRQMKVGASEKTFLDLWHPDGMAMFNISSSLRKVCWELTDPDVRLEGESAAKITLMSCFQPQLAQFSQNSFETMVNRLGVTVESPEFWIEEKLDGERMQMHMVEDNSMAGGKRFAFWSRKGKDYTYLYGKGIEDENSSLTRYLEQAFDPRVRNIILDGEMITWDPERSIMVGFGTLKTAALGQQRNVYDNKTIRPLFRVFDCLYMNDKDLTGYQLQQRHEVLNGAVRGVHERLEIHKHDVSDEFSTSVNTIKTKLGDVIAQQAEGLVLKNPRSRYEFASRNDNWMKVKPEYMMEFGESLDCLVIGGYYGTGRRGGGLSSFLCGLRVDENEIQSQGADPMKFWSFFKVGGGFRAEDYATIKHHTDGKWIDWDVKNPPKYIELGGGLGGSAGQAERPDQWIKPSDSVVVDVKAASADRSDSFRTGFTLRFPRFKRLRIEKDWQSAMTRDEFLVIKAKAEADAKDTGMTVDSGRKITKRLKKEMVIAGSDSKVRTPYAGPQTKTFDGLTFCVLSEMIHPAKKSKAELEQVIKINGGALTQNPRAKDVICIAEKKVVKVASLIRSDTTIIKPVWILHALKQAEDDGPGRVRFLLEPEPNHVFHMTLDAEGEVNGRVDVYGDSYARDVTSSELKRIFDDMINPKDHSFSPAAFLSELESHGNGFGEMPGSFFRRCVAWFAPTDEDTPLDPQDQLEHRISHLQFLFAGGRVAESEEDEDVTHFVVVDYSPDSVRPLAEKIAGLGRRKIPRMVKWTWLQDCWAEKTLLDEDRYALPV